MAHQLGRTGSAALVGALVLLAVACASTSTSTRARSASDARDAYLCCTLRFNQSHEASDAGYDYRDKTVMQAGTRVRLLRTTPSKAEFIPEGVSTVYSLEFRYGGKAMTAREYFDRIFLPADPRSADVPPVVMDAVRDGRLASGMTKSEAIMARGYPPAHRTPSTDADEWLYYSHSKLCEKVRFVDGRLASVDEVEPPH